MINRRIRSTTAVAALLVAGTALAGCGGDSSSSGTDNPAAQKGSGEGAVKDPTEPTTVTFFSWIGNNPDMKKTAAQFEKLHPNIDIKFENVPAEQAAQVLTTRIAGNNPPDVAFVNASDTADYAARGALVDLTDYIGRSDVVNPDDYVEAFKTFVTYQDKMWGLPIDGETTGLFYRTDMFEAAGIDAPPTTWDEFEADAAALTDPSKNQYGVAMFSSEAAYYFYPWLWQAGGDVLTPDGQSMALDTPEAIQ